MGGVQGEGTARLRELDRGSPPALTFRTFNRQTHEYVVVGASQEGRDPRIVREFFSKNVTWYHRDLYVN